MMRISTQWVVNSFMKSINRNNEALSKAQIQISSGKQFQTPSENPVNNALSMQHKTEIVEHTQYIKNIERTTEWLDNTDSVLTSLESTIQRARELAVQGANDTLVQADRDAIAKEIDQLLLHVMELGNTDIGGAYIFAGNDVKTKPFGGIDGQTPSAMTDVVTFPMGETRSKLNLASMVDVVYNGDNNKIVTEIEKGVILSKNIAGAELFYQQSPINPQPSFENRSSPITGLLQLSNFNNGKGVQAGSMVLKDSNGIAHSIDLQYARRLEDVIYAINSTNSFEASIDEVPSDTAAALGIGQNVTQANQIIGQPILFLNTPGQDYDENVATLDQLGIPPGFLSINTRDGQNRRVATDPTMTLKQLITEINNVDGGLAVQAKFEPILNRLILTDLTGGPGDFSIESKKNELKIRDLPAHTAADLSLFSTDQQSDGVANGTIVSGTQFTSAGTYLASLNEGKGVEKGLIRITSRDGATVDVNLVNAQTVQEVVDAINTQAGPPAATNITASFNPLSKRIELVDGNVGAGEFRIDEVNGNQKISIKEPGTVARPLGLLQSDPQASTIFGERIYFTVDNGPNSLLSDIVSAPPGSLPSAPDGTFLVLRGSDNNPTEIDLNSVTTIQGVIDKINATNRFQASWDPTGNRLIVKDTSGTAGSTGITIEEKTNTARDLGFIGNTSLYRSDGNIALPEDVLVGAPIGIKSLPTLVGAIDLNPAVDGSTELSSLNASRPFNHGVQLGRIRINDKGYSPSKEGHSATIDLRGAKTIQDVLDRINNPANGLYVEARINANRNGIELVDKNNGAPGRLQIIDVDSTTASDLGFPTGKQSTVDNVLTGGDIDPAVTDSTLVSNLRVNEGGVPMSKVYIQSGEFSGELDLTGCQTVGDMLRKFSTTDTRFNLSAWIDPDGKRLNLTNTKGQAFIKVRDLGKPEDAAASGLGLGGTKGIFETLIDLRDSLYRNDGTAISEQSIKDLDIDLERVLKFHTEVGAKTNRAEAAKEKQTNLNLHITKLLDVVENVDMTEAITRMTQLQTAFEAALQTGSRVLQTTLMDFLR